MRIPAFASHAAPLIPQHELPHTTAPTSRQPHSCAKHRVFALHSFTHARTIMPSRGTYTTERRMDATHAAMRSRAAHARTGSIWRGHSARPAPLGAENVHGPDAACTSCLEGHFLSRGACVKCPEGCSNCTSASACGACADGYFAVCIHLGLYVLGAFSIIY